MEQTSPSNSIIRFGVFELDRRTGELRKNGLKVHLQEQPVQILALLVERPGEVVTREELRQKLWADDTFVDFDQGLNRAVNKIREALGDSANNPRFVETLPRRGYRFIYPVAQVGSAAAEGASVPLPGATETAARSRHRRLVWTLVVVAALIALGSAARFFRAKEPPALLRAVPLTSYEGSERDATFSPDGNQVAFSWDGANQDNYDVYVTVIGDVAESPLRLTSDPAPDRFPAWSPDGRQIAFTRLSGEMESIYLISPLGGPERSVAKMPPRRMSAWLSFGSLAWSPDGRSLFFSARDSVDDAYGIHRLSIDTGVMTRLTSPPADLWPGDSYPAVAPDGHSLAFVRTTAAKSEILLTSVDGGIAEQLTAVDGWFMRLAWTASSEDIVSSRGHGYNNTLWRVPTLGGAPRQLPGLGENAFHPVISQGSGRLVFERFLESLNIYRYDLSGSPPLAGPRQKLIASTQLDNDPKISPDGRRIAFISTRSGHEEIWVSDRDGSNAVQLTAYEGISRPAVPKWSPDGRLIAFDCYVSGNFDVFVISSEGGAPRQLTTYDGEDSRPTWSHDGSWIYFGSIRTGSYQVWRMPAEGGDPVQVTRNGGYNPVESPDGKFVYYARQRFEPGLWRVRVSGGEEVCVIPSLQSASQGRWDVANEGVYFLELEDTPSPQSNWTLKFFRFDTGQVTRLAKLEQPPNPWVPLDVSLDGTWLLLAEIDLEGSDLMLVENFR